MYRGLEIPMGDSLFAACDPLDIQNTSNSGYFGLSLHASIPHLARCDFPNNSDAGLGTGSGHGDKRTENRQY